MLENRCLSPFQTPSRVPTRLLLVLLIGMAVPLMSGRAIAQESVSAESAERGHAIQSWDDQPDWVTSLLFLKDGRHVCIGTYEQLVRRDARGSDEAKTLPLPTGYVKSLAVSPDGKLIAAGHYQALTLIDPAAWSVKRDVGSHTGYVTGVAFSPDGKRVVSACEDGQGRIWNVADGKAVHVLRGDPSIPMLAIAFSPDGKRLATAAGDETRVTLPGEVKVWDAATGKELRSFHNHHQAATGVAFSPDGKWLASTGFDKRVILYDLARGKATSFFDGHTRPTNAVLFGLDGKTLASAAGGRQQGDNEVKIWERETGKELTTFGVHGEKVDALALSADGSLLASGGYDKKVFVFNVKGMLGGTAASAKSVPMVAKLDPQPRDAEGGHEKPKAAGPVRVGMIGLDTSHSGAFAKVLNDPDAAPDVAGYHIVAAYPRGSADIKSSTERIPQYTKDFQKMGIEIVGSIADLLKKVDVVLLETNDGRPHFEQALEVMKAGKPLFIDKPIAGSLTDAIAIFDAAQKYHVPVFCSSSLRFGKAAQAARTGKIGKILRCETTSPCTLEKTHPDLYWYGIHGVESLFTVMGTGCKSVRRTVSTPGEDVVVGTWEGGRTGTFRGTRSHGGYGGKAEGSDGTLVVGQYEGYRPLVVEIVKFFKTKVPPVSPEETIEVYAFMSAADESKRQHGAEVTLESVIVPARAEAAKKVGQ
jgi:predicted dehydrogenase/sugar lactone lactonase YvrE